MTTPADELKRWAFRIKPHVDQTGDHWTASYPGADWSVSASTKEQALQQLQDEVEKSRAAGNNLLSVIQRQHLQEAVPGVFAMDNELFREVVRRTGYNQEQLQHVFEEAERRRALGQPYTKADYLAEHRE